MTQSANELNPGSLREFTVTQPDKAVSDYSEALHIYRLALAAERGITLEQLHDIGSGVIEVSAA